MKLLVVLVAITALCAGSAIPSVPKDNSHYVEGESRYIWMYDGDDGPPVLVDLHTPVDEASDYVRNAGTRNQYWLYTNNNRNNRQVLVHNNANSIRNSHFRAANPTMVITHGWNGKGGSTWINQIKDAYLSRTNANVVVVDWSADAININYNAVAAAVPTVGQRVKEFLNFLISTSGSNWSTTHLVGHSLGAHVMGNAGRAPGGRPVRVTGLDPAGPQFEKGRANTLAPNSGTYVESIHTHRGLGIGTDISHADFFPHGGSRQPGCNLNPDCDHGRAAQLFASSLTSNHLVGRRCVDLNQARRNECTGGSFVLGTSNLGKRGNGMYGLNTRASWPF